MMEDLPSNSHRAKTETPESKNEKNIEQIVTGPVIVRKPSGFKRLRTQFIKGDATSVGDHVLWNVLMPAAKDMVADMGITFWEMMIYGERRGPGVVGGFMSRTTAPPSQSTSRFNYAGISSGGGSSRLVNGPTPQPATHEHERFVPNEIIVSSRAEAEAITLKMEELIERYTAVTVADLYRMIGRSINYTDDKWGWRNLEHANVKRVGQGVLLVLPHPEALD